nr:hypothetical protein [Tanacetum cinerariifolium]
MGVLLIEGTWFTIETVTIVYEWKSPRCDLFKIFGYVQDHCPKRCRLLQMLLLLLLLLLLLRRLMMDSKPWKKKKKKKKGKSKSTNGGQFSGHSVKQTETTATSDTQGNIPMCNPYSALDDEVENMHEESTNLYQSKKIGGSSSTFTDAAG